VLGVAALAMLLVTLGLSTLLSLGCAIAAVVLGRKGKQKVDRGETRKHRGLAQGGFICGLVGVPLSIVAIAGWTLVVLSEDFQRGFEQGLEQGSGAVLLSIFDVVAAILRGPLG